MAKAEFSPQPFDGRQPEIPLSERREVVQFFVQGLDGLFTEHLDDVIQRPTQNNPHLQKQELRLELLREKKKFNFFLHRTLDVTSGSYGFHGLSISSDPFPSSREQVLDSPIYAYILDKDATVRRRSTTPRKIITTADADTIHADGMTPIKESIRQGLERERPNFALAKQMGIQDQPVGFQEIKSAIDLAKEADSKSIVSFRELDMNHVMNVDLGHPKLESDEIREARSMFARTIDDALEKSASYVSTSREKTGIKIERLGLSNNERSLGIAIEKFTHSITRIDRRLRIYYVASGHMTSLTYEQTPRAFTSTRRSFTGGDLDHEASGLVTVSDVKKLRRFLRKPTIGN